MVLTSYKRGTGSHTGAAYSYGGNHMTREEMFQDIGSITVGLDDTFKFHCTQCGKCCIEREDIMLSPMDIFRMSRELKMSHSDFFHQYCSMHIGAASRMPIIMLKPVGKDHRCPLLKNSKCIVHKVKPAVCGMFPLGRYIAFTPDSFGRHAVQQSEVKYLLQSPGCGDESETHTVREWLGDFDIELEDKAFIRWNQALSEISLKLQELEKTHDKMTMMEIWFVTRVIMYECYDPDKEFLPQLERNFIGLKSLLMDIPKLKELVHYGRRS